LPLKTNGSIIVLSNRILIKKKRLDFYKKHVIDVYIISFIYQGDH